MDVKAFDNPADFAAAATAFLLQRETENNLLFGLLERVDHPAEATLRIVQDGDHPVAAALQTDPGHHLILSHASDAAIDVLAASLMQDGIALPGVQGSSPAAERFAGQWALAHGQIARLKMSLGLYQLRRVIPPARVPNGARYLASTDDLPVVVKYVREFCESIGTTIDDDLDAITRRRVAAGTFHVWKVDGDPVSMAAGMGPTPNGIRIGLVYTPPDQRNRGFASALVAALSQKLLDSGRKFCFLFTDMDNPTSNKIYRDIGYAFVCEQRQFKFDPAK